MPQNKSFITRLITGQAPAAAEIARQVQQTDAQVGSIVAAAAAVYETLGFGFPVGVYRDALGIEFRERGILYTARQEVQVRYHEHVLETHLPIDLICFDGVAVLVRSTPQLEPGTDRELISVLKACAFRRGVVLNFGGDRLDFRRAAAGPENP